MGEGVEGAVDVGVKAERQRWRWTTGLLFDCDVCGEGFDAWSWEPRMEENTVILIFWIK